MLVSSQNGLYYHPFLREEPASPEAQAYALRTLAEVGVDPRLSISDEEVRAMRGDAVAASPLWGRTWLIPLRAAGAEGALVESDAAAVAELRRDGGWYVDPMLGDGTAAARIGGTWAALELLAATDALDALPQPQTTTTAEWLREQAEAVQNIDAAAAVARSLQLIGMPVPDRLVKRFSAPSMDGFPALKTDARNARLEETYSYVLLRRSAGQPARVDRTAWTRVLENSVGNLDYEQLHSVVAILRSSGAGAASSAFEKVRQRLETNRLGNGTIRDPDAYLGSLDASLYVQRLQLMAGGSAIDSELAEALEGVADSDYFSGTGPEQLIWSAVYKSAGGKRPSRRPVRTLCQDGQTVPRSVTVANAAVWQRMAHACTQAGGTVRAPRVSQWDVETPEGAVAAAELVVGLSEARLEHKVPAWITPEGLAAYVARPNRLPSVYDLALVVRAHSILGAAPDKAIEGVLADGLAPYRGCPELPDLYQVGAGNSRCDLRTTWAVWSLDRRFGGGLDVLPARTGAGAHS
ncbi:hypothetical protein QNO07_02345 [Streptomyces sp. 549]|uniref:hypothetical protein n=1 Tax=Streptomyces sp. 549 TaxID=3049076 RepID=UPI0024C3EC78|nr:hypothetical protein [Streptomyces sp. 549]MDK1472276.1 hypothetical protein [Streptomyces sp. 549]